MTIREKVISVIDQLDEAQLQWVYQLLQSVKTLKKESYRQSLTLMLSPEHGEDIPPIASKRLTASQFLAQLTTIHHTLELNGYQFRTKTEIDRQLQQERDSWD